MVKLMVFCKKGIYFEKATGYVIKGTYEFLGIYPKIVMGVFVRAGASHIHPRKIFFQSEFTGG